MIVSPSKQTYPVEPDDNQTVEPHFSWSPCQHGQSKYCQLGGDRYDIEYLDSHKDTELKYMTVCSDCYYYLMTGERPDNYGS